MVVRFSVFTLTPVLSSSFKCVIHIKISFRSVLHSSRHMLAVLHGENRMFLWTIFQHTILELSLVFARAFIIVNDLAGIAIYTLLMESHCMSYQ